MTKEEIQKNSEHWYNKYKEVKHELEQERKLNAEIKARFVKCNTCTDEMKSKCLMFSENLCEGERCNQLLKDKGELTDKIADIKANCDLAIEGRDVKIMELEQQIEKMKNGDNCKYGCMACGNYICDLGQDNCNTIPFHCDKWEIKEND